MCVCVSVCVFLRAAVGHGARKPRRLRMNGSRLEGRSSDTLLLNPGRSVAKESKLRTRSPCNPTTTARLLIGAAEGGAAVEAADDIEVENKDESDDDDDSEDQDEDAYEDNHGRGMLISELGSVIADVSAGASGGGGGGGLGIGGILGRAEGKRWERMHGGEGASTMGMDYQARLLAVEQWIASQKEELEGVPEEDTAKEVSVVCVCGVT